VKEQKLSSIIRQLNTLLLTANALVCESGVMENAEKKYGFYLMKVESDRYKSGFYYAVRYKDPETKKWIPTKKSTDTDNETEAKSFAIENRDAIIREYKERKEIRKERNSGSGFYKMLWDYYQEGSKYLQDDTANGGRALTPDQRQKYTGFLDTYLIPYLRQKNVSSVKDITRSIYSEFKTYLQMEAVSPKTGKKLTTFTINTLLSGFVRILKYHERKGVITQLPYGMKDAHIKKTKEDRAKRKTPGILPDNYLAGILDDKMFFGGNPNEPPDMLLFMLSAIGLTCGMRNSEIGKLKRNDIKYIKSENAYYLSVFNSKTDFFNSGNDEYRKIPLHPFIVGMLKGHIQSRKIEKGDFLFFEEPKSKDKIYGKAVMELYRRIKVRETLQETGNLIEALQATNDKELEREMKEKNITFYSLRHTFQTLLATKYKDQLLLIDYFMGHKPQQKMLGNYLHINELSPSAFWNEYGKLLIDFQEQFIPPEIPRDIHNANKKQVGDAFEANKPLLNGDGTMSIDNAFDVLFNPLLLKARKPDNKATDDDFFDCV